MIKPRLLEHRLRAGFVGAHPLHGSPRRRQRGFGDGDLLFGFRVIEPGEQLPGFHRVALIHEHLGQPLLNARADGRLDARLQRARAHDLGDDFATSHGVHDHWHRFELEFVDRECGQRREEEPSEEATDGRSLHVKALGADRGAPAAGDCAAASLAERRDANLDSLPKIADRKYQLRHATQDRFSF